MDRSRTLRLLLGVQALYFVVTGVWPIVHGRSFEKVTGPKPEMWLVRTVGALVAVIGGTLGLAALRREPPPEVTALAVGSAASLAAVDAIYVARRHIAPIYLLDAVAEAVLIAGYAAQAVASRRRSR